MPINLADYVTNAPPQSASRDLNLQDYVTSEPEEPGRLRQFATRIANPTVATQPDERPWMIDHPALYFQYQMTLGNVHRVHRGMLGAVEQAQLKSEQVADELGSRYPEAIVAITDAVPAIGEFAVEQTTGLPIRSIRERLRRGEGRRVLRDPEMLNIENYPEEVRPRLQAIRDQERAWEMMEEYLAEPERGRRTVEETMRRRAQNPEEAEYIGPMAAFGGAILGEVDTSYRDIMQNAGVNFSEDLPPDAGYDHWYSLRGVSQLGLEFSAAVGEWGTDPMVMLGAVHGRQVQVRTLREIQRVKENMFRAFVQKGMTPRDAARAADDAVNGMLLRMVDPASAGTEMTMREVVNPATGAAEAVVQPKPVGLLNRILLRTANGRYRVPNPKRIGQLGDDMVELVLNDPMPFRLGGSPATPPPMPTQSQIAMATRTATGDALVHAANQGDPVLAVAAARVAAGAGVELAPPTEAELTANLTLPSPPARPDARVVATPGAEIRPEPPIVAPEPAPTQPAMPEPTAEQIIGSRMLADESLQLGADTQVAGTKGQQFAGRYAVMPRSLIQASHDPVSFAENPNYPLQNARDYSQPGEQAKVLDVRSSFDPAQHVTDSPDAAVGPVVVAKVTAPDATTRFAVLGGNNRQMAIQSIGPERQTALFNFTNGRVDRFGVPALQTPEQQLVRYVGEYDLRKEGERELLQGMIDALNPSPGKVQNMAEMAAVDAQANVPLEMLEGVTMDATPEAAQQFMATLIREGQIDRNLRSQLAENPAQAQEYTRRLLTNAAYRSPALAEFRALEGRKHALATGTVESAVPALLALRRKGLDDLADAFTRSMNTTVDHYKKNGKLPEAINFAAQQLEMDPQFGVVSDVASGLQDRIVRSEKGRVQTDDTLEAFEEYFNGIQAGIAHWEATPDLWGESRAPEDVIRGAIAFMDAEPKGMQVAETAAEYNVPAAPDPGPPDAAVFRRIQELRALSQQKPLTAEQSAEMRDLEHLTGQAFMKFDQVSAPKRREAIAFPETYPEIASHASLQKLRAHPLFSRAKAGDVRAALRVAQDLVDPDLARQMAEQFPDAVLMPILAEESTGRNFLPIAIAKQIQFLTGMATTGNDGHLYQANRVGHTGASAMDRLATPPTYRGDITPGQQYIPIDDVTTSGSTLAKARDYITSRGGEVPAVFSLVTVSNRYTGGKGRIVGPTAEALNLLKGRIDTDELDALLSVHEIAPSHKHLTDSQIRYIARFKSFESFRDAFANKRRERGHEFLRTRVATPAQPAKSAEPVAPATQPQQQLLFESSQEYMNLAGVPPERQAPVQQLFADLDAQARKAQAGAQAYPRIPEAEARGVSRSIKSTPETQVQVDRPLTPQQLEKQRQIGVYLANPSNYTPEIAAQLDAGNRVSTVIREFVTGQLPSWEVAGKIIHSSEDLAMLGATIRSPVVESFKVIVADAQGEIAVGEIVTSGILDASLIDPQTLTRTLNRARAINKKAKRVFLMHNHPSGSPTPSNEDLRVTGQLADAIKSQGFEFVDHVITNGKDYYSYTAERTFDFPTEQQALWEAVPKSQLKKVRSPDDVSRLVGSVVKATHRGHLAAILDTRNQIVALVPFDTRTQVDTVIRAISSEAAASGGGAVAIANGEEYPLTKLTKVAEGLRTNAIQLFDMVSPTGVSYRENGTFDFQKYAAEQPEPYRATPQVREKGDEVYGPFPEYGRADPGAAIAVQVPEGDGSVKLSDWIQVKLGGLEHVRPVYMPEMLRLAREMGATVQLKKLPSSFGYFAPDGQRIALDPRIFRDPRQAAKTLAHEIGHMADWFPDKTLKRGNLIGRTRSLTSWMKQQWGPGTVKDKELRKELLELTNWWKPYDRNEVTDSYRKYRESSRELYADALSVLMNAPPELRSRAPQFWNEFFKHIEKKPEVKQALLEMYDFLNRPESDILRDRSYRLQEMFAKGEELLLRKFAERELRYAGLRGWIDRFKMQNADVWAPLVDRADKARAAGKFMSWDRDPRYILDEWPLADNVLYRQMHRLHRDIIQPLDQSGFNQGQLGEYLYHNKILNERFLRPAIEGLTEDYELTTRGTRSELANPLGFTPDESRRGLLAMRLNLGNRPMAQLESLARKFQDMLYDAAVRAVEGGVYNREVFKTRIEPNRYSYATWATIEGLEHNPYIPAGVRQQAGTLSDIANPFTAATMKLMALERVIQYNKMKRAVIEMLHRDFGEAARAPVSYVAPGRFAPKPAPDGKVLVSFLVNGRPSYWYVEPMIERIFEGVTPAHANAALQALSIGFQKILYPMWISYNPAFLFAKNPVRDFRRTARNLGALTNRPVRAYFDLAREYRAHWSTSVARLRGEVPPLIANMLDNFAIGSPFDSFVGNAYQSKNVFDELMKQYSLAPEVDQSRFRNNKFIAPVARFLKGMQFYGQVFEALPKIAGFKILTEDLGWHPRAAAYLVRNFIGTPNYMKKGQNVALNGTLLPFYNIFLQGLQTDLQLATGRAILPGPQGGKRGQAGTMGDTPPKTAGAWWLSWAIGGGLFTILKAAGKNGLLGERIEKILDGQSDYTLSNYDVVPIGEIPGGEFGSKSVALRVPMDETQRIVNGMLYMMLNGLLERDPDQRQPAWEQFTSLVKYGGGQVPGLNPLLDIPHKWQLYLAGENPMDYYYGRPILTNDEHLRGGWDATVGMLKWTADQSGIRSFVRFNTQADTTLEGAIERTPIVNSLISISDYGYRQQQERPGERRQRQRARLRRTLPEAVRTNLSEYWQVVAVPAEDRTTEQWTKYYRLNTWYHSAYRPTWEAMLEHLEQGDFEDARRAGQYIPAE